METQDGFIVGVYNYCDRWCERCLLTSRCRVFAEEQRLSFEMQAGGSADPCAARCSRRLRRWRRPRRTTWSYQR